MTVHAPIYQFFSIRCALVVLGWLVVNVLCKARSGISRGCLWLFLVGLGLRVWRGFRGCVWCSRRRNYIMMFVGVSRLARVVASCGCRLLFFVGRALEFRMAVCGRCWRGAFGGLV